MVEWREFHHLKLAKFGLVSNQIGSNCTCQHFFLQSSRQVPGRWPAWPAPPGRLRSWRWTCPPAWCGGAFDIPHSIDHNNVPSPGPGITHGKAQHCILARERNQAENDTIETTWNDTSNSFSTKVVYKNAKNLRYFSRWFSSAFFIFVSEVILSLISDYSEASEKQLIASKPPSTRSAVCSCLLHDTVGWISLIDVSSEWSHTASSGDVLGLHFPQTMRSPSGFASQGNLLDYIRIWAEWWEVDF